MSKIYIKNNTNAVKCMKASGMPNLRLLPGMNEIDLESEDLDQYFKTDIAKAIRKESLSVVNEDDLTADDKESGAKAKAKNDELNKDYIVAQKKNTKAVKAAEKKAKKKAEDK